MTIDRNDDQPDPGSLHRPSSSLDSLPEQHCPVDGAAHGSPGQNSQQSMQFLLQHFPGELEQLQGWQSKAAAACDDRIPHPQPSHQGEQHQCGSGKGQPEWQQSQQLEVCDELEPSSLPEGLLRDMATLLERKDLVTSVRSTLLSEGFSPDVPHYRLPTLLQRMLKTRPMAYRTVEYRKRSGYKIVDGGPVYPRGYLTPAGLVRCCCHGKDMSLSQFEVHCGSQAHRPADNTFVTSINMSLKGFTQLLTNNPADIRLSYCMACGGGAGADGARLRGCAGCPAAIHGNCMAQHEQVLVDGGTCSWLCGVCRDMGVSPGDATHTMLKQQHHWQSRQKLLQAPATSAPPSPSSKGLTAPACGPPGVPPSLSCGVPLTAANVATQLQASLPYASTYEPQLLPSASRPQHTAQHDIYPDSQQHPRAETTDHLLARVNSRCHPYSMSRSIDSVRTVWGSDDGQPCSSAQQGFLQSSGVPASFNPAQLLSQPTELPRPVTHSAAIGHVSQPLVTHESDFNMKFMPVSEAQHYLHHPPSSTTPSQRASQRLDMGWLHPASVVSDPRSIQGLASSYNPVASLQPLQVEPEPLAVPAGPGAGQGAGEDPSSEAAVAAVLRTVTSLVGAVLAAGSLGDAQAAVFAEGGGLLESIMGLR